LPSSSILPAWYKKNAQEERKRQVIVLDASAAIDWLLQTSSGQRIERRIYSHNESLHAPHLLDLEVGQVLRRLVREGTVSAQRANQAIEDLIELRMARYPHFILLPRIWLLRHNLSAYDAAYVALAEKLGAPLLTRDGRLASASGHTASIELF
jgi:predicted nucleic acid-binding protein